MAATPELIVEDLTDTCWRDDQWLQIFPLNTFTALDYFSLSPFFVKGCNNDIAKMQGLDPSRMGVLPAGIEYLVQDAQEPHLFVIRRQYRSPAKAISPQAFYYILDGTVYQSPSLHGALSARLNRCLYSLRQAFQQMQSDLDPLRKGFSLQEEMDGGSKAPAAEEAAQPKPEAQLAAARKIQKEERQQMEIADRVILDVLRQFPAPALPQAQPSAEAGPQEPNAALPKGPG